MTTQFNPLASVTDDRRAEYFQKDGQPERPKKAENFFAQFFSPPPPKPSDKGDPLLTSSAGAMPPELVSAVKKIPADALSDYTTSPPVTAPIVESTTASAKSTTASELLVEKESAAESQKPAPSPLANLYQRIQSIAQKILAAFLEFMQKIGSWLPSLSGKSTKIVTAAEMPLIKTESM